MAGNGPRGSSAKICSVAVGTDPGDPALPVVGVGPLSKVRKSRRGRWRATVLLAVQVLIAAHITHFLVAGKTLSPVEPSESMYTLELGYVNAGFIFFAVIILATLVFGRFFCGWGCHIVALQDLCGALMKKLRVRPRPFRSRIVAFAPLAVALYMFVWPTAYRLLIDSSPRSFPGFTNHLTTTGFWDTFPGPLFAMLTFLTCGFAAVYFLGAKGFCTYGCPYGAIFGAADRLAPGKILVTDACEQCGHCTATCTSNVRVHEEVRLYGMVVDPGCMKCMDCINVCPKGALYYGFARPSLFVRARAAGTRARRYVLGLHEELALGALCLVGTLAFRGLYDGPPLLMSVGLGGLTAFASLKLWQLLRDPSVRLQNLNLKLAGAWRKSGAVFAALTSLWLLFTAHSSFVQWHRARGSHYLDRTQATREDVLSGAFAGRRYPDEHYLAADRAFRHFSIAERWGLAPVSEIKLGLAWTHLLRGDAAAAEAKVREAVALTPADPRQYQNLVDILLAQGRFADAAPVLQEKMALAEPTAEDHFQLANLLVETEHYSEAVEHYRACLALAPGSAPAHHNLGGLLRRTGRPAEAIVELGLARELAPNDAQTHVELGLAYVALGATDEAIDSLSRAATLSSDSAESRTQLMAMVDDLRRSRAGENNAPVGKQP